VARPPTGQIIERRGKRGVTYGARFRADGRRRYQTLDATTRSEAELELANILADVRRGIWRSSATAAPAPEQSAEVPTFHVFASQWVERHRREVRETTRAHWTWLLSGHLLPFLASYPLDAITPEVVDRFKVAELQERERYEQATPAERKKHLVPVGLSPGSINKCLALLARILDEAIDYGLIERNAAKGRNRRLKAPKPRRTFLEPREAQAVLDAAPKKYRPLLATMLLAGPRVSEATSLRCETLTSPGAS